MICAAYSSGAASGRVRTVVPTSSSPVVVTATSAWSASPAAIRRPPAPDIRLAIFRTCAPALRPVIAMSGVQYPYAVAWLVRWRPPTAAGGFGQGMLGGRGPAVRKGTVR